MKKLLIILSFLLFLGGGAYFVATEYFNFSNDIQSESQIESLKDKPSVKKADYSHVQENDSNKETYKDSDSASLNCTKLLNENECNNAPNKNGMFICLWKGHSSDQPWCGCKNSLFNDELCEP